MNTTEIPEIKANPATEGLYKAGVQFGYSKSRRHPRMRDFVAGVKNNIEVFQLDRVKEKIDEALEFIESLGEMKAPILWVGTKPAAALAIKEVADALGHPYVNIRWLGGTLTNNKNIRGRVTYWQDLISKQKSGELGKYTKAEQVRLQKESDRLARSFEGLVNLQAIPKAMFVIDSKEEDIAVHEAGNKKIPVVALMNTDCDPKKVKHAIPGNDNASKSIRYILELAQTAYIKGTKNAKTTDDGKN
ncbi:MAG: 30S ribosomal protein S2 [bacterium]|nr:30S ribosomal protein S2 [bacterium]